MNNRISEKYVVRLSLIYKWHSRYSDYRDSVRDDARSGRPVTYTTSVDVIAVKSEMNSDCHLTAVELCEHLDTSYDTVRRIIIEELKISLVCEKRFAFVTERTK